MKFFILLFMGLNSFAAFADARGNPDQDKMIRRLRDEFGTALPTYPVAGWKFDSIWACHTYNAFQDDFYHEPDATLRLETGSTETELKNTGNMIFKDISMTILGLQSVKENWAYFNHPVYFTMRPVFSYGPHTQKVKSVRLVGEVSVNTSILKDMATYYGYAKPFVGVPSLVDPSKTVYYYFTCSPVTARAADRAEARSRTWSIPAELSRLWPIH